MDDNGDLANLPLVHGRVRDYARTKGYGFVDCDDGGEAYFTIITLRLFGPIDEIPNGTLITFTQRLDDSGRRQVFRILALGIETDGRRY